MTADFAYDPVTAIDEAQATGETAVLLAEIRQTMRIPLVTSIWRGLAGMDDSLRLAWAAAKPIYESGEPERALMRSVAAVGLPRPEPLAPTAIVCVGLTESDIVAARAVIAAYNRSNGLNLMALAALIAPSATGTTRARAADAVTSLPHWPPLPPLLPGVKRWRTQDDLRRGSPCLRSTEQARTARRIGGYRPHRGPTNHVLSSSSVPASDIVRGCCVR